MRITTGKLVKTIILLLSFGMSAEYVSFGGEIFSMSGDARISALGGANPSLYGSSGQMFSNPALGHIQHNDVVTFTYRSQFSGLADFHLFSTPLNFSSNQNISLGVIHRSVQDIPYTNNAFEIVGGYPNPIDYDLITMFDHTELAAVFSVAGNLDKYQMGINIKTLIYSIYTEKAFGIGLDLGSIWNITPETILGITLHDIPVTAIKWSTGQAEWIPVGVSAGVTHTGKKWLITGMFKIDKILLNNFKILNRLFLTIRTMLTFSDRFQQLLG